jgi:DNA polymerase III subunit delta
MKIAGSRQDEFVNQPNPEIACIMLFGPDRGLVHERALTLVKTVVDDLNDPFRVVEIHGADLKSDPARLADEAKAVAFGGGRRLIRIKNVNDTITKTIADYLEIVTPEDALIIIEGGELGPRSSLRKLFEKAKKAASIACYGDNARNLPMVINETLTAHGLKPTRDAMAYLVNNLGSDRSITRGELEKLSLYMGAPGSVELADATAAINDNAAMAMDDITLAVGCGDKTKLDKALVRTLGEGIHPIQILRATARHFLRLHEAAGMVASGKDPTMAMKSLKPPVIFMQVDKFRVQLQRWHPAHISDALNLLIMAEMDCKTTGAPVEAICWRTLMRITQAANH